MSLTAIAIATSLAQSQSAQPDAEAAKARMEAALTATGFTFSKTSSGLSFRLDFTNGSKNTIVLVGNTPYSLRSYQAHMIYTTVWYSKDKPSDALIQRATLMSKKVGGFYGFKDAQGMWSIRFSVHYDISDLPAVPDKDQPAVKRLKDTIYFVNQVGQETEKELAGQV